MKNMKLRYAVFTAILAMSVSVLAAAVTAKAPTREIRLYFVDSQMLRLMPVTMTIPDTGTQNMARRVLDELISGRDDNPKIRRLIPDKRRCMTVKVKDETAYVDLKRSFVENHPEGRDLEILIVYSIVNSLTEVDGVKTVRFTIEGKTQKKFIGHLDMRETFVPDYFV